MMKQNQKMDDDDDEEYYFPERRILNDENLKKIDYENKRSFSKTKQTCWITN
jgi:hypothetical protein